MASNTASLVLYVLGIISASKYGTSITAFVIVALSVPLFWVGAFIAWNKQYDGKVDVRAYFSANSNLDVAAQESCSGSLWRQIVID